MYSMFVNCKLLTSLNLNGFNTQNVEEINYMFEGCSSLNYLDISNFYLPKIKSLRNMFNGCSLLTSLNLSNFKPNDYLTDIENLFCNCSSLFVVDISNLKSGSSSLKVDNIFFGCSKLKYVNLGSTSFPHHKNTIRPNLYSLNNDIIVCGISNFFSDDNSLCEIGTYCINNLYGINVSNDDYHCFIKCKEEINNTNITCPYYTPENKELDNDTNLISTNGIICPESKENLIEGRRNELLKAFNKSYIDQGNDIEIYEDNLQFALSSTYNQKQAEKASMNKTAINLGECETKLKNAYNISINDSLYIFKIDKKIEGMKIPKIEYEVYYPLYTPELYQLNLTICENTKIDISIPISLNDSLEKYDTKSDYYNNLCSKTTSESGTDISLKDRKSEFIDNNMTICEENYEIKSYDYNNKKVKCSCEIKIQIPYFDDIHFNKKELLKKFIDINNIGNLNIILCIKNIFSKDYINNNYGFYTFVFILVLFFICLILFYLKFYQKLLNQIKEIVSVLKMLSSSSNIKEYINDQTIGNISFRIKKKKLNKKIKNNNIYYPPKKKSRKKKFKLNKFNNCENIDNKMPNPPKLIDKNLLKFSDIELNTMKYKKALLYDKRTFMQYYLVLLKKYHLVFFSFYFQKDYNPQIIKIFLFFFFFSIHFTTNALFFDDSTMHKKYEDKGNYNWVYQLPSIFYSSLISDSINSLILYLALSEKDIIKLKNKKNNKNLDAKIKKTFNLLKIKFALFFIVSFIILLICACYIICFCGVYNNTQIHLIKDTMSSFVLSLIYPFGKYLIISFLRIYALRDKNKDKSYIYSTSQFFEDF